VFVLEVALDDRNQRPDVMVNTAADDTHQVEVFVGVRDLPPRRFGAKEPASPDEAETLEQVEGPVDGSGLDRSADRRSHRHDLVRRHVPVG
jgi:hypothetical protein